MSGECLCEFHEADKARLWAEIHRLKGRKQMSASGIMEELRLAGEFDAKVWAQRFVRAAELNPGLATDEGTMIGWFANAIMAGYDHRPGTCETSAPEPFGCHPGTVKWFNETKGFGFIQQDGGGPDVYVHCSEILGDGYQTLADGDRVSFRIVPGLKGPMAESVARLDNEDCGPREESDDWDRLTRVEKRVETLAKALPKVASNAELALLRCELIATKGGY